MCRGQSVDLPPAEQGGVLKTDAGPVRTKITSQRASGKRESIKPVEEGAGTRGR